MEGHKAELKRERREPIMSISAKDVKALRDRTGAGMMDCKKALEETGGDMEAAIDFLRAKGAAKAAKRAEKSANEGTIGTYLHFGGKIGVMIELNCETDFVAKTEDFVQLAKDLAMHIAAANPIAVRPDDIDEAVIAREKSVFLEQIKNEGKPDHIAEKIVEGKLRKFFEESSLLQQPFVKDPQKSIEQLITEVSAKTGEKIEVARFCRLQVGGGS
jgi:elongation factor Ts